MKLVMQYFFADKTSVETWMTLPFPLQDMLPELDDAMERETTNDLKFSEIAVPQKSTATPEYLVSGGSISQLVFGKQWGCDVDVFHCNPNFETR